MNLAKAAIEAAVQHHDLSAWVQKQLALAQVAQWAYNQDSSVSANKLRAEIEVAIDEINAKEWS